MIPQEPASDLKLEGLSRDEIKKIQKSMKKPEFMGLLNQYMVEISDPKNKAEYDQYLKQMEKEGELPKHMKLIKLKPEFCFRTQIVSSRNKKHEMKFFINMCSSDYIEKPSCEPAKDENGGTGYSWKVPNSLGKIRYDQDKHKNPCQVIDCAFHPDTFVFSNQNTAFQAMIISIALEGAEKQLGERKEHLSKDYIILKNVKCKGENGEPALLPIRYIEGKAYNRGQGPTEQERNLEGRETKLQKELTKQKEEYDSTKKQADAQKAEENQEEQDLGDGTEKKKLIQDLDKGVQAPKFTSIYTYITDYSEFIDGPTPKKSRSLPSTFTVQFKVPRMENISQASTLQINDKKIILAVSDKYFIDVSFQDMKVKSYPLKHAQAKAKFDKKKKTLRVQIPVDVSSIPYQDLPEFKDEAQGKEAEESGNIVENQTWKNKVLEIQEPVQTEKFLSQEQAAKSKQEQKKLIEQIDQDDVVQEKEKAEDNPNQQQLLQSNSPTNDTLITPFSISTYYPHEISPTPTSSNPTRLPHILKQLRTHIFLTFYMRNYNPERVRIHFDEEIGEVTVLWTQGRDGHVAHLRVHEQFRDRCARIYLFNRVSFVSVVVEKLGKCQEMWGEACVRNLFVEGCTVQHIQTIIQQKNHIKQQKIQQAQQQQRLQTTQPQPSGQQIQESTTQSSGAEVVDSNIVVEPVNHKEKEKDKDKDKDKVEVEVKGSVFQKLPVQFLRFSADFVEVLN